MRTRSPDRAGRCGATYSSSRSQARLAARGISLIELLVVLAILGILFQLLLPAVQAVRESARKAQCREHLRELGLAAFAHESALGRLPCGGWRYNWAGDPDRGNDRRQPGGWVYNLLPYLEQRALHERGRGLPPDQKRAVIAEVVQTSLPLFNCPTRRSAGPYPVDQHWVMANFDSVAAAGKSDYAANAGERVSSWGASPFDLREGDSLLFPWLPQEEFTGVIFQRSELTLAQIVDGASCTYLFGEKYLNPERYDDPEPDDHNGDNQHMYAGYDEDSCRWAVEGNEPLPPLQDRRGYDDAYSFGSAHPAACHFVFCDGSVRSVDYSIDGAVHIQLCNRRDGGPIDGTLP